jgi:hypothetical protein
MAGSRYRPHWSIKSIASYCVLANGKKRPFRQQCGKAA